MPSANPYLTIPLPVDGVRQDLLQRDLPATALWEAENWILRDGRFAMRNGLASLASSVNQRPMGFAQYVHNDGGTRLVMATTLGWFQYDRIGDVWISITGTPLAGADTDQAVFRVFDRGGTKYLLGVNGKDSMKVWDGTSAAYTEAGGSPPRARCMAISNDHIFLFNLKSGATISGAAYTASASKDFDAGWGTVLEGLLVDTPGEIVSALEFGNLQTAVYKTDAIYMMFAQGSAIAPVRFELKTAGIPGPVSSNAAVAVSEAAHAYLASDGGVYLFDGVAPQRLGRHIQKWIADRADFESMERAFGIWDRERQELFFSFPQLGSREPNLGVVIYLPTGALWPLRWPEFVRMSAGIKAKIFRQLTLGEIDGTLREAGPRPLDSYQVIQQQLLLGDTGGQVYTDTNRQNDAGAGHRAFFESGMNALGEIVDWKTLVEIEHLFRRAPMTQAAQVTIGAADHSEDRVLGAPATIAVGDAPPYRTGHRISSRSLCYRVDVNGPASLLTLGDIPGVLGDYPTTKLSDFGAGTVSPPVEWRGAVAHFAGRGRR